MIDQMWLFAEPKDTIATTSTRIIDEGQPILFAAHGVEDGRWLFLDAMVIDAEDEMAVELGELAQRDPSILDLAELPPGWQAQRQSIEAPWIIYPRCC
jgi:hypothetical protein